MKGNVKNKERYNRITVYFEYLGLNAKIILKQILKKYVRKFVQNSSGRCDYKSGHSFSTKFDKMCNSVSNS